MNAGPFNTECWSGEVEPSNGGSFVCPGPIPGLTEGEKIVVVDDDDGGHEPGDEVDVPPELEGPGGDFEAVTPDPNPENVLDPMDVGHGIAEPPQPVEGDEGPGSVSNPEQEIVADPGNEVLTDDDMV